MGEFIVKLPDQQLVAKLNPRQRLTGMPFAHLADMRTPNEPFFMAALSRSRRFDGVSGVVSYAGESDAGRRLDARRLSVFMGAYAVLGARLAASRSHKVVLQTSPPARMASSAEKRDRLLDGALVSLGFDWEMIDGERTLTRRADHILSQLGKAYPDEFAFNGR